MLKKIGKSLLIGIIWIAAIVFISNKLNVNQVVSLSFAVATGSFLMLKVKEILEKDVCFNTLKVKFFNASATAIGCTLSSVFLYGFNVNLLYTFLLVMLFYVITSYIFEFFLRRFQN